eukprot:tig00001600_g9400.t1
MLFAAPVCAPWRAGALPGPALAAAACTAWSACGGRAAKPKALYRRFLADGPSHLSTAPQTPRVLTAPAGFPPPPSARVSAGPPAPPPPPPPRPLGPSLLRQLLLAPLSALAERRPLLFAVALFLVAGLCEIGGGWMVWKAVREGAPRWWAALGSLVLVGYGFIPTLQRETFGRTYAAYGGFFIVLSLLWGALFDGFRPDRYDLLGSLIALAGVALVMFAPRK